MKKGDRVKVVTNAATANAGDTGVVTFVHIGKAYPYRVAIDGEDNGENLFSERELKLIKSVQEMEAERALGLDDAEENESALDVQEGGSHYKDFAIQPIEYIHANDLSYCEANIVKYATRWRDKGGIEDLRKIKHYVNLLIELEELD